MNETFRDPTSNSDIYVYNERLFKRLQGQTEEEDGLSWHEKWLKERFIIYKLRATGPEEQLDNAKQFLYFYGQLPAVNVQGPDLLNWMKSNAERILEALGASIERASFYPIADLLGE